VRFTGRLPKERELTSDVGEDEVVVVGHHHEGVEKDAVSGRGDSEDVPEDVVGELRGLEKKLPLRAAPRDEVGGRRDDLARRSHRQCVRTARASVNLRESGRVAQK
jgi:hypothetical protein